MNANEIPANVTFAEYTGETDFRNIVDTINVNGTDYGRSLALNGVKLFAVWSDELEETANGYVYTTEAGAREAMAEIEANDREAGVYEPDYWKVSDMTKYFA